MPQSEAELVRLRDLAVELAWQAGRRTLSYFQTGLEVESKADGTPVTRADREAEMLIRQGIRSRFPNDGLEGEEYGTEEGRGSRTWIIDPIDGTKSFVHGVPLYAVLIAVAVEGKPLVGVICLPALGEIIAASRGSGCWWNGRRARVSEVGEISQSLVTCSDFPGQEQERTPTALYDAARLRRTWGDAYGYSLVATGRAEVMIDPEVSPWDVAAIQPIIEEAGGRFSDLRGRPDFRGGHAMATNGRVHDQALDLVGLTSS